MFSPRREWYGRELDTTTKSSVHPQIQMCHNNGSITSSLIDLFCLDVSGGIMLAY